MPNKKIEIAFHGTRKEIADYLEKTIKEQIGIIDDISGNYGLDNAATPDQVGVEIWVRGRTVDVVRVAKASAHIQALWNVGETLGVAWSENFHVWTNIIDPY